MPAKGAQYADFSLSGPEEINCLIGESATATITVSRASGGKKRQVSLMAKPVPGISVEFAPETGLPSYLSEMTVFVAPDVEEGVYEVEVEGVV